MAAAGVEEGHLLPGLDPLGRYLDAEAVTVLAELATRRMIEAAKSGTSEGGCS